jgi:hypothetical protein
MGSEAEIQKILDESVTLLAGGVDERVAQGLGRIMQAARNIEHAMRAAPAKERRRERALVPISLAAGASPSAGPTYAIVRRGGDQMLEERRPGRQPFRVNRRLYDAVVNVLAEADKPLEFDKLSSRVRHHLNRKELPAYLPRTALRWWLSLETSPIVRAHSEYERRGTPEQFRANANDAWKRLAGDL